MQNRLITQELPPGFAEPRHWSRNDVPTETGRGEVENKEKTKTKTKTKTKRGEVETFFSKTKTKTWTHKQFQLRQGNMSLLFQTNKHIRTQAKKKETSKYCNWDKERVGKDLPLLKISPDQIFSSQVLLLCEVVALPHYSITEQVSLFYKIFTVKTSSSIILSPPHYCNNSRCSILRTTSSWSNPTTNLQSRNSRILEF